MHSAINRTAVHSDALASSQSISQRDGRHYITRAELDTLVGRIEALESALHNACHSRRELEKDDKSLSERPSGSDVVDHTSTKTQDGNRHERKEHSHALLKEELLEIKNSIFTSVIGQDSDNNIRGREEPDNLALSEMMGMFGTLSIGDGNTMRFLGPSAVEVSTLHVELMFSDAVYIINVASTFHGK